MQGGQTGDVTGPHPNCSANLTGAPAAFGVPAATLTTAFNVFMRVRVDPDGALTVQPLTSTAGLGVTFRAERDVLVAVSACAAVQANGGGAARPLGVEIGAAPLTP